MRVLPLAVFAVAVPAQAANFVVVSEDDVGDCTSSDGVCVSGTWNASDGVCENPGPCTLRAAIEQANANAGLDSITFSGVSLVTPSSALPGVIHPVTIDGGGTMGLGGGIAGTASGLYLNADGCTVTGLEVSNFTLHGIVISASDVTITGCDIHHNGEAGVMAQAGTGAVIGGSTETLGQAPGNRIYGNGDSGVWLYGVDEAVVRGNLIGTPDGVNPSGNHGEGVHIENGSDNVIGGSTPDLRNIISANIGVGVKVAGESAVLNEILGNYIGVTLDGNGPLANTESGIYISYAYGTFIGDGDGSLLGGPCQGSCNVISMNGGYGITMVQTDPPADGTVIMGNFIGTNAAGTAGLGNGLSGVYLIGEHVYFGGDDLAEGNLVSGNLRHGIGVYGPADVEGNRVGTDTTGMFAIPNAQAGIYVQASQVSVGGHIFESGNLVSGNTLDGILVRGFDDATVEVRGNIVGLDATGTGVLPNGRDGIAIAGGVAGVIVGPFIPEAEYQRNVVAGNLANGIRVGKNGIWVPSAVVIRGNYVGTDHLGATDLGNALDGILLDDVPAVVGEELYPSLIAGNGGAGVHVRGAGAADSDVVANTIGTEVTVTSALPNDGAGVWVEDAPDVDIGRLNVIAGNAGDGVLVSGALAAGTDVFGNLIGVNADGSVAIPNENRGVHVDGAPFTLVGDASGDTRNIISGNADVGVRVSGVTAEGTLVIGNFIGTNREGTAAIPNAENGVVVSGAVDTLIASSNTMAQVISGNADTGVVIAVDAQGTVLAGNYIGVDVTGAVRLANEGAGVSVIGTQDTQIGDAADAVNVISGNDGQGIYAWNAAGLRIGNNYIGTDASGMLDLGNWTNGVVLEDCISPLLGLGEEGGGNVISGNGGDGVLLDGGSGAKVLGNLIGSSQDGLAPLGNADAAVYVTGTVDAEIGGLGAFDRNVLGGSDDRCVRITGSAAGTRVRNNYISADISGQDSIACEGGIRVETSIDTIIGGDEVGAGNVISGNDGHGVELVLGAVEVQIVSNVIGQEADGGDALLNDGCGVDVDTGVLAAHIAGNVISGNAESGICVRGADTVITANYIGTDLTDLDASEPNEANGIVIDGGEGTRIGDGTAEGANYIAYNDDSGVRIAAGTDHRVTHNLIFENYNSIDLGAEGPDTNDLGDADTGPNGLQNSPTLNVVVDMGNGTTLVQGFLEGPANEDALLEIYLDAPDCDGDARDHLHSETVALGSGGRGNFSVLLPMTIAPGIVTTATTSFGTSELTPCTPATSIDSATDLVLTKTAPPTAIAGGTVTFTLGVSNSGSIKATGISIVDVLPAAFSFVSAVGDCVHDQGTVTCSLAELGAGVAVTFDVTVAALAAGLIVNAADVTLAEVDLAPQTNHAEATVDVAADADLDGILAGDNCPIVTNADQADADSDGAGDLCDLCPADAANDADADGVCGNLDNCPLVSNSDQADADSDSLGDLCEEDVGDDDDATAGDDDDATAGDDDDATAGDDDDATAADDDDATAADDDDTTAADDDDATAADDDDDVTETVATAGPGPSPPAAALDAAPGTAELEVLQLLVSNSADEDVRLGDLTFAATGDGDDAADISAISVWVESSGVRVPGTQLYSGTFGTDDGTVALTPSGDAVVPAGGDAILHVTLSFAAGAGDTCAAGLARWPSIPPTPLLLLVTLAMAALLARRTPRFAFAAVLLLGLHLGCGGGDDDDTAADDDTCVPAAVTYQVTLQDGEVTGITSGSTSAVAGLPLAGSTVTLTAE